MEDMQLNAITRWTVIGAICIMIVLSAGCGVMPGTFTTKAHKMDQQGRSGWVDNQLRTAERFEEQGNREMAEMIRENLYSIEVMKIGCEKKK